MEKSHRTILVVLFHLLMIILVLLPTLAMYFGKIKPYQRGFYCDDESIRYPYKPDTISILMAGLIGMGVSLLTISLTELVISREYIGEPSKTYHPIPQVVVNIYKYWGIFIFGFLLDQMIVNTSKFLIGRPRPHFISACNLDFSKVDCTNYNYVMINNTFCRQTNVRILTDMRLSFPSGHSSFSAYCAVAFTVYLMRRWSMKGRWTLIRTICQAFAVLLAILCSLSRISDYKHHPTDVLAGFVDGTLVGLLVWLYLLNTTTISLSSDERNPIIKKDGEDP